ncbi:hypothetical protein [Phenylobacterium sp.]|nr:hypothetical protein [Phenylobacterium sp.]
MQRLHLHHYRNRDLPPWAETLLAGIVIAAVIAFNVIMMWRIATATV